MNFNYLKSTITLPSSGDILLSPQREVELGGEYYIPYFDDRLLAPKEEIPKPKKTLQVGERYALQGTTCDEFEMPTKVYEVKKILDIVKGITLNSVVVKQVSGPTSTIFSLTKDDCKLLGIPFETSLQIFPLNQGWIRIYDSLPEEPKEVEFDVSDLSTYPTCAIDGTIRRITMKLSGFEMLGDHNIKHEQSSLMSFDTFMSTLKIYAKKTIKGDGIRSTHISQGRTFPFQFLTSHLGVPTISSCVDAVGNIYIEFDISLTQGYTQTKKTQDKRIGVKPNKLVGEISDYFGVKWMQREATTLNAINTANGVAQNKVVLRRLINQYQIQR